MNRLELTPKAVLNRYKLLRDFSYEWNIGSVFYKITVPQGTLFEASIPRIAWTILGLTPGHPKVLEGACVHDFLYQNSGILPAGTWFFKEPSNFSKWFTKRKKVTRKEADKLFFRIMKENGVKRWKRRSAYNAVRIFGGSSWKG